MKCNRSKGNFYISEEMILGIMILCLEQFDSFKVNDEGLTFSFFKQSIAMLINAGQIHVVESLQGPVIFIDIGLHFKNGQKMYLVAMENDPKWIDKMRWCIVGIMTKHRIFTVFQIKNDFYFPLSSTAIARTYFEQ